MTWVGGNCQEISEIHPFLQRLLTRKFQIIYQVPLVRTSKPVNDQCCHHIETRPLICSANQFYKSIDCLLYGGATDHVWNKKKSTGLIDSMIGCPLLWFTWNCNWLNSPATRSKNFPGSFLKKELHVFLMLGEIPSWKAIFSFLAIYLTLQMEKNYKVFNARCQIIKFRTVQASIYLLKVNKRNTRTRREICSKLTIKTPTTPMASFFESSWFQNSWDKLMVIRKTHLKGVK